MTDSQRWLLVFSIFVIGALLYVLAPVLTPFMIAVLLAYLFNPVVDKLTTWHLPRVIAIIIVFIFIFFILLCLIFLIVPLIEQQIIALIHNIPKINNWLNKSIWPWFTKHLDLRMRFDLDQIKTTLTQHLQESSNFVAKAWSMISHSGIALIGFFTTIILIPVVTFYLLCDWKKIVTTSSHLLPRHYEKKIVTMIQECGEVLAAFFRGQLLVMISLGIIYAIGLWLIGLNIGILIGFLAGLFSIVPYLGFITGISIALISAFIQFGDWTHILLVIGVFCIGEMAESFILIPWLVGDRVGLHPVAVIFAILAGGQLFGFIGVLLAVPVSAVILVLLRHLYAQLKVRQL